MSMPVLNLVAVVAGAVVCMIVGMAWYSPALFGKKWMASVGMKEKDAAKNKGKMMPAMAIGFVSALVMSSAMGYMVDYSDSTTFVTGAMAGIWIWIGFVATILGGTVIWEGKSLDYYLINAGHYLVVLVLLGIIHAVVV